MAHGLLLEFFGKADSSALLFLLAYLLSIFDNSSTLKVCNRIIAVLKVMILISIQPICRSLVQIMSEQLASYHITRHYWIDL